LGHLLLYSRIKLLLSELFPGDDFRRVERTFKVVEGVIGWIVIYILPPKDYEFP